MDKHAYLSFGGRSCGGVTCTVFAAVFDSMSYRGIFQTTQNILIRESKVPLLLASQHQVGTVP